MSYILKIYKHRNFLGKTMNGVIERVRSSKSICGELEKPSCKYDLPPT